MSRQPSMPARRGVGGEAFQAVAHHRIEIGEQQQRNLGALADLRRDLEHASQRRARLERALAALLDHRPIGDRIGERHAEFDQVGAAAHQRLDQRGRALGRGVAGGEVGDQTLAIFALQGFEQARDAASLSASSSGKFSR